MKVPVCLILLLLLRNVVCSQTQHETHEGVPTISLMILFLFMSLLYGGLLKQINKKTGIPYTPMLFMSGIAFGKFSSYLSYFGMAVDIASNINPHGILMIFLPILIFESGFNADWHIFKKQFGQTFILAFPCVFVGSLIIMLAIKLVLRYDDEYYTWSGAFMFGSILSCTDTVAVLALLKQIGAPKKFNSLIEGQSLLNDGSAMVLFQISSQLVKNHPVSFFDIIYLFFSLTVGGVLLGLIFAVISTYWIRRIFNDGILVVNITIISCYMVYFIAENIDIGIKVSGIIALVSLGLYMAAFGKTRITTEAQSYVQGFWSYSVFCAETIIFIIAGIIVGTKVLSIASFITIADMYKLIGLYFCMVLARFLAIAMFMRILPKLGYGLTWKEVYVLTYGGLRGAIGMSFALIVFNDDEYNQKLRQIILFDMAGNVILTLLVNGITTGPFVRFLGLSSSAKIKQKTYIEFIRKIIDESHTREEGIRNELYFNEVEWQDVHKSVGRQKLQQLIDKTQNSMESPANIPKKKRKNTGIDSILQEHLHSKNLGQIQKIEPNDSVQIEQTENVIEMRNKFLMALKTQFWQFLQTNNTSAEAAVILIEATNWDLDAETEEMNSWQWINNQINQSYVKFLLQVRGYSCIGRYARNYLFNYVAYSYDIVSSYIEAHEIVRSKAQQFRANKADMNKILDESLMNQKRAEDFLKDYLNPSFPEISIEIQTKKAAFNILQYTKNILNRYLKTGQLDSQEYQTLKDRIDKRVAALELHAPHWKAKSLIQSVRENDIFSSIPDDILMSIENKNEMPTQAYDPQINLFKQGNHTKFIFLIRRGSCTLEYQTMRGTVKEKMEVSDLVGLESIMSQQYKSTCIANAITIVHQLKATSLIKLFQCFPEFQDKFWIKYFYIFVYLFVKRNHILEPILYLNRQAIEALTKTMEFNRMDAGKLKFNCYSIILRRGVQLVPASPLEVIQPNVEVEMTEVSSVLVDRHGQLLRILQEKRK